MLPLANLKLKTQNSDSAERVPLNERAAVETHRHASVAVAVDVSAVALHEYYTICNQGRKSQGLIRSNYEYCMKIGLPESRFIIHDSESKEGKHES
jgi:hypothetical protein